MKLLKLLLALIAPPIAVLLERGLGGSLLLNILLTLLAWLPGAIHALIVVTQHEEPVPAAARI
ncbi:MAG TPA: YqaE/Pmp3 family membrane protein [Thermoanaerobaculia bacterium]|nr:YqaE/Pmp3 family membrane protein [Thermoanaerobaculia bacterium]